MRRIASLLLAAFVVARCGAAPFEFRDGDRIVFLGDTWVEREQSESHIEARLTARIGGKQVIFRNLAWSADTVLGESRASFDPPEKGFDRVKEQLQAIKPTVAILGYGMAESFKGKAGLDKFTADLNKLIDTIQEVSKPEAVRLIMISPLYHEKLAAPLPDPATHNEQLRLYANVVAEVARARQARFIDLFAAIEDYHRSPNAKPLTDNGIHPTPVGYRQIATMIERALELGNGSPEPADALRQRIVKKNELFFHRWRPQNQTYLFGFRKYEQGQNAKEIPMFDPLISDQEAKIRELAASPDRAAVEPLPRKQSRPLDLTPLPQPAFTLDENLEVTLFAENPDLAKPIHMNFDPQGRLWVASSAVYPQIMPGQEADDKILILEDTDGDGKSDKTTIFADGLLIPTGVEPGDGGAYVANSTELLFYKDTDGDGRADEKRIMLSGFGTEDTHHILHSLRWGHDGQLYMNQSIYIHSHIETPHGVVRLDSGGILNLRPPTQELGIHMKGLINSWGHHFDRWGQSFATDGAGHEGINWIIPQAMYVTYEGARRILHGVSPGSYPKFCGLEIIESEHFPEDWQGTMVTCDFRAHRVVRFAINDQDAGYITKELPDVMRTTNVTFRPIDVKVGPDGAIYVADWSNPIIQHGEVDFRDPRRDHEHGRIWRITYKNRPLAKKYDFVNAPNGELIGLLGSPNGYVRQRARRVLTERGKSIEQNLNVAIALQSNHGSRMMLELLWMYQSIDVVNEELLRTVLNAPNPDMRAAALRVLSFWHPRVSNSLELLAKAVKDEHPRVRVEAVRAAAKIPQARSAELVLSALDLPLDRFLDYAIWLSINDLAEPWVKAVQSGEWKWEGREKQLEFALQAVEPQYAAAVLNRVLEQKPIDRDGTGPWIALIAKAGSREHLGQIFARVLSGDFSQPAQVKVLNALAEAARLRQVAPERDREKVTTLFKADEREVRTAAIRLAGRWKLPGAADALFEAAKNAETRGVAFQSLREIGGADVQKRLALLSTDENELAIRVEAVKALTALDLNQGAPLAVEVLTAMPTEEAALSLWRALLSGRGAASAFAQAIPKSGLPEVMVKAGLRAAREGGRTEPNLVLALARNIDAEDEAKNLSPEELKRLLSFIQEKGDPVRGELVYRRQELGCVSCHAIGGVGGKVGPDLTSIGASAPPDYLVESMLFPNRKVKEGYHAVIVETSDEQELSGILVRETEDQLIIRDAGNREVSVAKNTVVKRRVGGSIMPAGLIDALNEQEQADLYRFLSELGKPGPFDASKGNVARVWQVMPRTLDVAQFTDDKVVTAERTATISHNSWEPMMTLVNGRLSKQVMEQTLRAVHYRDPDALYLKAGFEVPKSGLVRFELPALSKALVWIDGKPVRGGEKIEADLASGPHTLAIKLDAKALPDYLLVTSPDATFVNH